MLGFGKNCFEMNILEEVEDLLKDIHKLAQSHPDGIVNFQSEYFSHSIMNVLWTIIGGKRFDRDDFGFQRLLHNVDTFMKTSNQLGGLVYVPAFFLRRFPWLPKLFGADTQLLVPVKKFIQVFYYTHSLFH